MLIVIVGIVAALSNNAGSAGTPTSASTVAVNAITASPLALTPEGTGAATEVPATTAIAGVSTQSTSATTNTPEPTITRTSTPTRTPTPTNTPSPLATKVAASNDPADIELVYDAEQANVLNVSGRTLDISNLSFVQRGADDRHYEASDWDSEFAVNPVANWPITRCYQVARFGASGNLQPLSGCSRARLAAFRYVNRDAQFWVAQDDQTTTFEVLWENTSIATCVISAGSCRFLLKKN